MAFPRCRLSLVAVNPPLVIFFVVRLSIERWVVGFFAISHFHFLLVVSTVYVKLHLHFRSRHFSFFSFFFLPPLSLSNLLSLSFSSVATTPTNHITTKYPILILSIGYG